MNEYTLSYRVLNGNVHRCVFASNRPVSLNWTDYNSVDPDEMPRYAAFNLGLVCLQLLQINYALTE